MANDASHRTVRHMVGTHPGSALGSSVALLLVIATVVYHWLEGWSWVDSFYFSTVAVTTVGFGDLSPSTDASKLFTVLYLATGLAAVTTYLNHRFNRLSERRTHRRSD